MFFIKSEKLGTATVSFSPSTKQSLKKMKIVRLGHTVVLAPSRGELLPRFAFGRHLAKELRLPHGKLARAFVGQVFAVKVSRM
jgi:hypothetical protein